MIRYALALMLCSLPALATAQVNGAKNMPTSFENIVTFNRETPVYIDCYNNGLPFYDAGGGLPCQLDNGELPGSPMNSGILSMSVPRGGGINFDMHELKKPWIKAFRVGWDAVFYQCLPLVFSVLGLWGGYTIAFTILKAWSPEGSEK